MPERLGFISNLRSRQPAIPTGRWIGSCRINTSTLRCARRRPRYRAWIAVASLPYRISPRGASTRKEHAVMSQHPLAFLTSLTRSLRESIESVPAITAAVVNASRELYTRVQIPVYVYTRRCRICRGRVLEEPTEYCQMWSYAGRCQSNATSDGFIGYQKNANSIYRYREEGPIKFNQLERRPASNARLIALRFRFRRREDPEAGYIPPVTSHVASNTRAFMRNSLINDRIINHRLSETLSHRRTSLYRAGRAEISALLSRAIKSRRQRLKTKMNTDASQHDDLFRCHSRAVTNAVIVTFAHCTRNCKTNGRVLP